MPFVASLSLSLSLSVSAPTCPSPAGSNRFRSKDKMDAGQVSQAVAVVFRVNERVIGT